MKPSEFDALIERIRAAEANKSWQQPDWKDEALAAGLFKLVESVKATTGKDFLKLPVEFQDVSATRDPRGNPREGGLLRVARGNVSVAFANKSVFLVDGSIRISHAADCIVIARGIVEISHSNRNVILAGHHVNIGSDGMRAGARPGAIGDPPQTHGSLVCCGGSIDIAHAHGTSCSAPKLVEISHANQVAFLATQILKIGRQQRCTEHKDFVSPVSVGPPATVPADLLTVKQVVAPDDLNKQLVTVERNRIEYVLRPGDKLVDQAGQPIPNWSNWTVGFVTENTVLFTDGLRDMIARAP